MSETLAPLIDGVEVAGEVNVKDDAISANIAHSIRLGHPQLRPEALKRELVALVGSGPSLNDTEAELRGLVQEGAKIVALNGAFEWCVERNFVPSAVVVVDARAENARFVARSLPKCIYYIASQCHPDVWQTVTGHDRVVIWHPVSVDSPDGAMLDVYYGTGRWAPVTGGTTVATRALALLRMSGYLRFDLFGIDSCWLHGEHHAFPQAANASDRRFTVTVQPARGDVPPREFECAPWHIKQLEDLTQMIRVHGHQFRLRIHGDGLLAHAISACAEVSIRDAER